MRNIIRVLLTSLVSTGVQAAVCDTGHPNRAGSPGEIARIICQNDSPYCLRFKSLYDTLHNSMQYYSCDGLPYHSVETLIVEAPDYGHLTTSESLSYAIQLESVYGLLSGDFSPLNDAWSRLESFAIPGHADQPTNSYYNAAAPATYAAEYPQPSYYPSPLQFGAAVGQDPVSPELAAHYGTWDIYGMHWLIDSDNIYGYGQRGDGVSTGGFINTFQRGEQESVWETVPHPSWEAFLWGGPYGFLNLFTGDSSYARQWRYTNAPDADARIVQSLFQAKHWAEQWGLDPSKVLPLSQAGKMGDYLRLAMFDKYFRKIGTPQEAGTGYDAAHYLLSWYYAWGGATEIQTWGAWAWRIGASHIHFGYQNPVAAWALSQGNEMQPTSPSGGVDWSTSLQRQLEFYRWLQSSEGAIAGGATNNVDGQYSPIPPNSATFYGMAYDDHPVYHDPGSNTWFGWQAWSIQRLAEYYYLTNDPLAREVMDKWVAWVKPLIQFDQNGFSIPAELAWSGQPDDWTPFNPGNNDNLHVNVVNYNQDVGIAASLAKLLIYYSAAKHQYASSSDQQAQTLAKQLLDDIDSRFHDDLGYSATESRPDYTRIWSQEVYIPLDWNGVMANGEAIHSGIKFIDLRSFYLSDPEYQRIKVSIDNGQTPSFRYHRYWAQVELANANALYYDLIEKSEGIQANIQLNGRDGPLSLGMSNTVKVTLSLVPNQLAGTPVEAWFWYQANGIETSPAQLVYTGPAVSVEDYVYAEFSNIPAGQYKTYLLIDTQINGLPDLQEDITYQDSAELNID